MSFSKLFSCQIIAGTGSLGKIIVGTTALFLFIVYGTGVDICRAAGIGQLYRISNGVFDCHTEYHEIKIPSGGEIELANIKGPGKITYFYITDDSMGRFYSGLVLKIFWDDQKYPSVNVQLSDFFGAIGGKTVDYQSSFMQINHFCYMCYLPMPFCRRARFILANDGDSEYSKKMAYGIDYEKDKSFSKVKSRLHCCWKRSNPTKGSIHNMLDIKGQGHYVGNFLHVRSLFHGWWGEGDTIFNIDGKAVIHTPGTEDEYGSCWGFGGRTYCYMYSGHILNEDKNNRMYRWYPANPVRFRKSLKVDIQNQRWEKDQTFSEDDYISVVFWYQDGSQAVELQPYHERTAESKAKKYTKR
jgi:hypothetical protein